MSSPKHSSEHEFIAGNFGPTTAPLCKHCGLSEQAATHKPLEQRIYNAMRPDPAAPQPRKATPRGEPDKTYEQPKQSRERDAADQVRIAPLSQPSKAAQADPFHPSPQETTWQLAAKLGKTAAELERVKESLAVAQSQIDNNDVTLAQVKLVYKSQLERVKQQLAIAESCIKNNDAAFETVKQQLDRILNELNFIATTELTGEEVRLHVNQVIEAAIAKAEKEAK